MKKARKLIPALAMLLISAVMMSTASFAWFSMNTEVEANGMQVEATAAKNLIIATASDGSYSEKVTPSNSATTLIPASTTDFSKFFKSDNKADYNSGALAQNAVLSEATNSDPDFYYVKHSVYIKTSSEDFDKLYVSAIQINGDTGATQNISKAIRVGIVSGTTKLIFAPAAGTDTVTYRPVKAAGTYTTASIDQVLNTAITTEDISNATTLGAVDTTAKQVDIYIWYEGQDTNCTSANSINVENLSITVKFRGVDN